ncbi:MAG: DASS family sodium-coupled anion symporter [Acidobacteria bacterium]|nr:DASS family sodium-coupled anion symporter [Acidobacteriota bacterium]MBU4307519.1 DASS family sodium-coupled anion symporter [Acidobacteriota bacterium]MBU4404552.1 DASS family sodium-coupled anion symporter [Acidobacteriota bacterium]MCG2810902.1 DASS family sodium-coupled anion symporter [Candidatus Aminicenantes bacterium]
MENELIKVNSDYPPAEISPLEEKIEFWRQRVSLFLGPLLAGALLLVPMPGLSPRAHTLAAVISWVVVWWIGEPVPIPVSAIFGAVLCILAGVGDAKTVLAPFAEPTIFLFLGSFILARAMSVHALDRRLAYGIMSMGWIADRTWRILFAFGAIAALLSMWISNTATTAMMLPIGIGMVSANAAMLEKKTGRKTDPARLRFATAMMLMAAYASSTGGIGTPVGTPPNLIGIAMIEKFAGVKIPFFQWMLFAVPMLLIMYGLLFLLLYFLHKPEMPLMEGSREFVRQELVKLGPWSRGQKNSLAAFLVTVSLWVIPGFLAILWGSSAAITRSYGRRLPEAVAALIGASLLFILPLDWKKRQFTISWRQALNIDWGTLLLFGGGLSLGNLMFETKLAEHIGQGLLRMSGAGSMWAITFAAIFIAIIASETTSNTAAANMVIPVIISLALAAGVNPVPPALGAILGCSWGFMLPVSTPPNAIVYGSGLVPIVKMIRAGLLFDLAGGLVIWAVLRLLLPLIGLA